MWPHRTAARKQRPLAGFIAEAKLLFTKADWEGWSGSIRKVGPNWYRVSTPVATQPTTALKWMWLCHYLYDRLCMRLWEVSTPYNGKKFGLAVCAIPTRTSHYVIEQECDLADAAMKLGDGKQRIYRSYLPTCRLQGHSDLVYSSYSRYL